MSETRETEPCEVCGCPYHRITVVGDGEVAVCEVCDEITVHGGADGDQLIPCPWCERTAPGLRPRCPVCSGAGATTQRDLEEFWLSRSWSAEELRKVCLVCGAVEQEGAPGAPTSHGYCSAVCARRGLGLEPSG